MLVSVHLPKQIMYWRVLLILCFKHGGTHRYNVDVMSMFLTANSSHQRYTAKKTRGSTMPALLNWLFIQFVFKCPPFNTFKIGLCTKYGRYNVFIPLISLKPKKIQQIWLNTFNGKQLHTNKSYSEKEINQIGCWSIKIGFRRPLYLRNHKNSIKGKLS